MILSIYDYFVVGYLIILLLLTAYFRRDQENKYRSILSFIFLINVSISIVAFFCLFYLVENHENYLIIYFILSIFLLLSMILINHYKNKNEK